MNENIGCDLFGMLDIKGKDQTKRVYSSDGIAPTIVTPGGGGHEVKIAEPVCVGNVNPSGNWMNGNVYCSESISPTLTTNKGEGIKVTQPMIIDPQGRVGKECIPQDICPTLRAKIHGNPPQVVEPIIGAIRGRNPDNPSDRTTGIPTQQMLEIGGEVSNTLTTVQKDNVVVERLPFRVRKLTPRECYRLMAFDDDDYDKAASVISSTQLYKTAGNSIVVDVLAAIFKEMIGDDTNAKIM